MSSREHSRFEIWNAGQHPYKHVLEDFSYTNPALPPGSTTLKTAVDSLFAVLYPQSQPGVATVAALPAAGNTLNDMRVVADDGDGKAASYRWEQREGEATPSWHKIYDLDFGSDSVLQAWQIKTQDVYVSRYGYDDRDSAGVPVTGMLAGQTVYGGASANTNLTLFANSGDGTGPATGFVQLADPLRPLTDNALDLGTALRQFKDLRLGGSAYVGSLLLASGSITDTSGMIDFGDEDLITDGQLTVGVTLLLDSGTIEDTSGAIDFIATDLITTGDITARKVTALGAASAFLTATTIGDLTLSDGSIVSASGSIDFIADDLDTTGTVTAGELVGTSYAQGGNLRLAANVLSSQNANGNVAITPNGTGTITLSALANTGSITATGTVSVTGQFNADDIRIDGDTVSNTAVNGNVQLSPNGTGDVITTKRLRPSTNDTLDLGASTARFNTLYLGTQISDGTTAVTSATLQSLRDINVGVASGMSLFWNGSKWVASAPDTEIDHGTISGLLDDDHTQYALLAGRAGGQSLIGGSAVSNNLDLESTSHATKGSIRVKDATIAFTDASFAAGWAGIDLGASANRFRHLYTAGEFFGLRTENVGALPSASSQRVGRLVFLTADNHLYVDSGTNLLKVGDTNRFQTDTAWNGIDTTKNVTVTTLGMDARQALWQLRDNSNNYEQVYASITATTATNVLITSNIALPAGSYRLVGLE